jgi:hypothetical protein
MCEKDRAFKLKLAERVRRHKERLATDPQYAAYHAREKFVAELRALKLANLDRRITDETRAEVDEVIAKAVLNARITR